jgi:hypothetical protein
MRLDDLQMLHRLLRHELDAAYAVRPWDGARIDHIAADLLQLERSLAACHAVQRNITGEIPAASVDVPPSKDPVGRYRHTSAAGSDIVHHSVGLRSVRLDAWGKEHR